MKSQTNQRFNVWTMNGFLLLGVILLPLSSFAAHTVVTSDFERKIVSLYQSNHCAEIKPMIQGEKTFDTYRANIIAVIAACEPDPARSEALFSIAESKDPYSDLIMALHAKSLQRISAEAAQPYWRHVLMYARNESLREIAREAISGHPVHDRPLNLSPWTWSAQATLGTSHHSSPWFREMPWLTASPEYAADTELSLKGQRWITRGSIGMSYRLEDHRFPEAPHVSTQNHLIEVPFSLRIGKSEDLGFRPFFEHQRVGGKAFANIEGFGLSGVSYRNESRQSISGYAASEQTVIPNVRSPVQAHYHFDYQWEWFPINWYYSIKFGFDNVSASRINQIRDSVGDFNQNHNDLFGDFTFRRGIKLFSLGLTTSISGRLGTAESRYIQFGTTTPTSETRVDSTLTLEPHIIWRFMPQLQMRAFAKWNYVWSNIARADYGIERSHENVIVGFSLRTYWSSY